MNNQDFSQKDKTDHSGAFAEAFFIANLLFIGIFYIILWGFYFVAYKKASQVSKNHIKQTLWASTLSTAIAIALMLIALLTTGFASVQALIMAEVYLMLVVPLFMILGILGFTKAVNGNNFKFPIIGNLLGVEK